ncbi:MAG: BCCT family transporter [Bacillota bacterium]
MERKVKIDPKVFWPALIVVLGLSLPLVINPELGAKMVNAGLSFVTGQFGWLFLLFGMFCFITLMWLAFGKYGHVKLGGPDDEPEFSYVSWVAMLFCAGIGIGIMLWSIIEPIYYLEGPPFGFEPHSQDAIEWAHMYGQFHWGFSAWAIYAIPTIPIAYSVYVRKEPFLRISAASKGVLGNLADGWLGKVIDAVVAFGIVGAVGTSLGLAVPLVSALFSEMFGVQDSFGLNLVILAIWTAIFGTSVYRGLSKGIKVLSDVNMYVAIAMALFILFAGPTVFILKMSVNSWGIMLDNFFRMSFWMDPIAQGGFPEGWTIFYWAWWIAYAPMMGLFVARISKGRTIRDVVIAECLWGTLGCWVFFCIFGAYSTYLDVQGILSISQILSESGSNAAIIAVVKTLPGSSIVLVVYTFLCFIFLATTLDSSAYTLASVCSKDLRGDEQPARWHRVFWALVLAVVAVGLLAVGGLSTVQTSTIVVALPLIPVLFVLVLSSLRWLEEDYGHIVGKKILAIDYQPKGTLDKIPEKNADLGV